MRDSHKFKVWDKKRSVMIYYQGTDLDGYPFIFYLGGDGRLRFLTWDDYHLNDAPLDPNDFIILRCTGLRDTHNNLIHEGDIVLITNSNSGYGDPNEPDRIPIEVPSISDIISEECDWDANTIRSSEIIGNIYEHPHLIGGKIS